MTTADEMLVALLASKAAGGPRTAAKTLLSSGRAQVAGMVERLSDAEKDKADVTAHRLRENGVAVLLCDDPRYPDALRRFSGAPPALFYRGPIGFLASAAIGLCGSRDASAGGLRAARACGEEAARCGVVVVSGYAKGVDTEGHLAALESGGATVAVLAEGIDHFRVKPVYRRLGDAVDERMLVVSQFPPGQRWTAGAAMTRNQVVIGLSRALVVVEARETGGTRKAGEVALQGKRPVWVLDTGGEQPPGNAELVAAGARPIADRVRLAAELRHLAEGEDQQLLPLP